MSPTPAPASTTSNGSRMRAVRVGIFSTALVGALAMGSAAQAQLTDKQRQDELEKCEKEQRFCPAYTVPRLVPEPATNPDPRRVENVVVTTVAPATAAVAGVTVTTAPTTVTTVAPVVSVAPTASVLGVTIEEQAEDVAFTGSESGRYSAAGFTLTAVGASLIAVSRRRRRRA